MAIYKSQVVSKAFNTIEIRDEIMQYLLGWEMSSLIVAVNGTFSNINKNMCLNMVRNIFQDISQIKRLTNCGEVVVVLGPLTDIIMKMIKNPDSIKHWLKELNTHAFPITIVRMYEFANTNADTPMNRYRWDNAYSSLGWNTSLSTTESFIKLIPRLLTPTTEWHSPLLVEANEIRSVITSSCRPIRLNATVIRDAKAKTKIFCTGDVRITQSQYASKNEVKLPVILQHGSLPMSTNLNINKYRYSKILLTME